MLLNLDNLVTENNLNIRGLIHIGSHYGQEYEAFRGHGCTNFLMFEPVPWTYDKLIEHIERCGTEGVKVVTANCALGKSDEDKLTLYLDNRQQASTTALKPVKHLELYPDILFDETIEVPQRCLDSYLNETEGVDIKDFNMINIDVGGYELEVFKGAEETLNHIDYVMTEVNREEMYENTCRIEDLDKYLGEYGFVRVATAWPNSMWGDAFYVKNEK